MRPHAHFWPLAVLALYYCLFFLQKIPFVTADLGRHLTNGRVIWETGRVFDSNFYSYAVRDFHTVNHHWFFGVFMFGLQQTLGFGGLTVANALALTLAVFLMLVVISRKGGTVSAAILGFVVLPLITYRSEVRPETVSFLLVAVYFFVLDRLECNKVSRKGWLLALASLALLQICWTNSHLFFVFGPALAGYFWLRAVILKNKNAHWFFLLGIALTIATLCNPAGISGALQPLTIFTDYGYLVAENQSIPFMLKRFGTPRYWYAATVIISGLGVAAVSLTTALRSAQRSSFFLQLTNVALLSSFTIAAWQVNRMLSFFGLIAIPVVAPLLTPLIGWAQSHARTGLTSPLFNSLTSILLFVAVVLIIKSQLFLPQLSAFGIGLAPGSNSSADFFKTQKLLGPIFNNYDIGGYLIYHLYPHEHVFTDNRPEAYPASFFTDAYIPAQEDEEKWHELDAQYRFNIIYFYRHDATPWAQPFLLRRLDDPDWVPVFVDEYAIILVRNDEKNKNSIDRYKIHRNRFLTAP